MHASPLCLAMTPSVCRLAVSPRAGFAERHSENILKSSHGVRRPTIKNVARDPFCSRPSSREAIGKKGFLLGGRTRARTWDPLIKSQLLYQLSYAPGAWDRKAFASGRRLAKPPPDVQQGSPSFPASVGRLKTRKSRRNPAASLTRRRSPERPVLRAAPARYHGPGPGAGRRRAPSSDGANLPGRRPSSGGGG